MNHRHSKLLQNEIFEQLSRVHDLLLSPSQLIGMIKLKRIQLYHINISNFQLSPNSDHWPNKGLNLDWEKNYFMQVCNNSTNFYQSYAEKKRPILPDFITIKTHYLFVIDGSRREISMKSSTVNFKLNIEAKDLSSDKTKGFCFIIHHRLIEYSFNLEEFRKNNHSVFSHHVGRTSWHLKEYIVNGVFINKNLPCIVKEGKANTFYSNNYNPTIP